MRPNCRRWRHDVAVVAPAPTAGHGHDWFARRVRDLADDHRHHDGATTITMRSSVARGRASTATTSNCSRATARSSTPSTRRCSSRRSSGCSGEPPSSAASTTPAPTCSSGRSRSPAGTGCARRSPRWSLSSLLVGTALSVMVTWWSRTMNPYQGDTRFDPLQFDLQGLSPVAFTLFGAALGLLAGAAWRRTLPAIATTIAGYFAVRLAVELWLRPHYEAPITTSGQQRDDAAGRVVAAHRPALQRRRNQRADPVATGLRVVADPRESDRVHDPPRLPLHQHVPAGDRYWTFQWIEAGIFVALAAAACRCAP